MNPRDRIDRLSLWSRNSSQYPQRGSFQWFRYRNPSIILALYSRNFCFGVGRGGGANRVIFSPQNMFYPELSINNPIFKRKKWILISCYFSVEYEYRTQAWLIVIGAKRSCIRPYIGLPKIFIPTTINILILKTHAHKRYGNIFYSEIVGFWLV